MENYHKSSLLAILIGILPLIFELSSNIWHGDNGFFIISAAYGLILLLLTLSIEIEDLDQWFAEKALSYLSVFLSLTAILNKSEVLPFAEIGSLYRLAIIAYMGTLYFLDRHFNTKNLVLLLLNLNILAQLSVRSGTILILIVAVLTFIFYVIRVVVTFSEQLRPFLLCVYLIVLLVSLVWYTPEFTDFVFKNLSWNIEAISLLLETLGAIVYIRLKRQLNINSHLILGTVLFLIINEGSLIIAESNVINTSYLVLVLIIDLCIVNVFGNIELGRNQRKISVIIPAHNSANTIVEALESIKNQTYRDWEIILINDGSNDETETIVKRYLENTPLPVKYHKQKQHNYLHAIEYGTKFVEGSIIFVLDADKVLFNQNVFYRAASTLYGEKCDGMFVGIRAMYQRLKDGKLHLIRPYYRNQISLVKTALGMGVNIYTNYAFWRREVFETSVRENYLVNGMPSWCNAQINFGLRMVNGNFVGLKYRIVKNKKPADKQLNQDQVIAELRTLHHITSKIKIPFYRPQAAIYYAFNKCHIASLCPVIFKQGKTSLKEITPLIIENRLKNVKSPYLQTIVGFSTNYNPEKKIEIIIPKDLKVYHGADIEEFIQKLKQNKLAPFYANLMKVISQGTSLYVVNKKDREKLTEILEFFTIRDYVKIISK